MLYHFIIETVLPLIGTFFVGAVGWWITHWILAALDVEIVMDAIERAVPVPQAEVIMHSAARRQALGQIAPLTAGAQDVHHAVDHLAHVDPSLAAAPLARRNERLDKRPFLVGEITRIAQPVAVVAGAVFSSPHGHLAKTNRCHIGIT
jgi:hypothetical protein